MQLFGPGDFLVFKILLKVVIYHLVECFDLAIFLWMIRRGERLIDLYLIAYIYYLRAIELRVVVGHNQSRDIVSADDVILDEIYRVCLGDFGQWLGFHTLGKIVDGDDGIFVLLWRPRKHANDIYAPFGKGSWNDDTA